MKRSKKWFFLVAVIFLGALFYASYDIARRTTFPGSKGQLKERIKKRYLDNAGDTIKQDSLAERN